jgi:hypothetical protein
MQVLEVVQRAVQGGSGFGWQHPGLKGVLGINEELGFPPTVAGGILLQPLEQCLRVLGNIRRGDGTDLPPNA